MKSMNLNPSAQKSLFQKTAAKAGNDAFQIENGVLISYCGNEEEAMIPAGVTRISKDALLNCTRLTGIVIPESVETIGEYAFGGCHSLRTIRLRPDDPAFPRDYSLVPLLTEELKNVWKMRSTGDYSASANMAVKYPLMILDYLHTHSASLAEQIRQQTRKIVKDCIANRDVGMVAVLTQEEGLFDAECIDRCIGMAQGQSEILMLLMNYKNAHVGFGDKPLKL